MRLATIRPKNEETLALVTPKGFAPIEAINERFSMGWSVNMLELMVSGQLGAMNLWYASGGRAEVEAEPDLALPRKGIPVGPPYRRPPKIWGIGLNYQEHHADLASTGAMPDTIPGSFMKADTTIIGPGDAVKIPLLSRRTTGEGELGIIIGKRCKDVERDRWLDVVAGFTTVIDMTAEDILKQNTRYLTVCKNFDTFFSFGPELVTPDEVPDVLSLHVSTVLNGEEVATNTVSNMRFPPDLLVSYHSRVMTLLPGDIISTGTPRAVPIQDGDLIECHIDGFAPLANPVVDLKARPASFLPLNPSLSCS